MSWRARSGLHRETSLRICPAASVLAWALDCLGGGRAARELVTRCLWSAQSPSKGGALAETCRRATRAKTEGRWIGVGCSEASRRVIHTPLRRHARAVAAPNESANGRSTELARGRSQSRRSWWRTDHHVTKLRLGPFRPRRWPVENNHPAENMHHGHVRAPHSRASRCTSTPTERAWSHSRAPRERRGTVRASVAGWLAGRSDQRVAVTSPPAEYARRRAAPSPLARRDDRDACVRRRQTRTPWHFTLSSNPSLSCARVATAGGDHRRRCRVMVCLPRRCVCLVLWRSAAKREATTRQNTTPRERPARLRW